MERVPFILRLHASGLNISPSRRDELYVATQRLVVDYSQHRDGEKAGIEMGSIGNSVEELRLISRSMDKILKREFGSPYSARAVVTHVLTQRALLKLHDRSTHGDPPLPAS